MNIHEIPDGERRTKVLIDSAIRVFGIDISDRPTLRGIPRWALTGKSVGATYKYRAALDHSARGDELTAISYPADREHSRDRLTTLTLSVHPLKEDVATFDDAKMGETPIHLEGIPAQNRIAVFLAEAQADISSALPNGN